MLGRRETTINRLVRNTSLSLEVKERYDYQCQVCGERLRTSAGPYVEAAHIRPLGHPHDGPDTWSNSICLCPNHHVRCDYGALSIQDNLQLLGAEGKLLLHQQHHLDVAFLAYHRERFYVAG